VRALKALNIKRFIGVTYFNAVFNCERMGRAKYRATW